MEMAGYKSQICLAYRTGIIQHNPTCLYNTVETGITAVQHKHTRLLRLHGKRQIFPFNPPPQKGIVCNNSHLYDSNWTPHSSASFISREKYEARNDEWHTACITVHLSSLGVDIKRAFHPVFSSFS